MLTIFHNSRCSKSKAALEILEASGQEFEQIFYLETPPSKDDLQSAIAKLGRDTMLRKGEEEYSQHIKNKDLTDIELINLMQKYPNIIERPLVTDGNNYAMGRPPENIKKFLKK